MLFRRALLLALVPAALGFVSPPAGADTRAVEPSTAVAISSASQGIAVLATTGTRAAAFTLARAVYGSPLRPRHLDEVRARILAGDPAPAAATRDVRELAELRKSVAGDDAASRQLLATIAQQLHLRAILVVLPAPGNEHDMGSGPAALPKPAEPEAPKSTSEDPAGAITKPTSEEDLPDRGRVTAKANVLARLFLSETGELDAARYAPDDPTEADGVTWRGTVSSLSGRFPAPAITKAQLSGTPRPTSDEKESHPFYMSPWLWGAVGAAALLGGLFFVASRDTGDDPIRLQMRVPR